MGNLSVVAELDQIPFDDMAIIPETARIVSAAMTWEDHSLAGNIVAGLAKSRNMEVGAYRQNLLTMLLRPMMLPCAPWAGSCNPRRTTRCRSHCAR